MDKNRSPNQAPDLRGYRVVILPGTRPLKHQIPDYNSAYAMWKLVWAETFRELDGLDRVYADDFTRQDEIVCLFKEKACLAMGVMRWVNFELTIPREDSYFKVWPEHALDALAKYGPEVIICSNLTVHPLARGNKLGFPAKDVMVGLLVQRLIESGAHAMTGTMRADRGMHKTTYQFGAEMLVPNLIHHHAPVDLVAFYPQNMAPSKDSVTANSVEYLWNFCRDPETRPLTLKYKVS